MFYLILMTLNTRMQSLRPNPKARYRNIPDAFYKIIRYEGVFRPIRGMSAVVTGAGPAHALYFSCYEKMKQVLSSPERRLQGAMVHGLAGCFSTLIHDAIMNPAEMIKQRMQMYGSPYKTCTECLTKVWKGEGVRAFYRSYTTQLTMNLPFQSIHFMTYEFMQDLTNHERTYNPKAHMMSGAIAGGFAAAVTTPLDVCKTLLNTQEKVLLSSTKYSHNHRINGLVSAAIAIYEHSGLRGYTQGMQARIIYQVPSTAIAWSVYEFFKYFIEKRHFSHRHEHNNPIVLQKTTIEDKPSHMLVTPLTIVYNE